MLCEPPTWCPEAAMASLETEAPRPILIVEDDQDQRDVLEHRLHKQGFRTLTADGGRAAVALAREHRPQLILLDLEMPDGDGLTACHTLFDDPNTCELPVIIVSGSERADIVRVSRAAGCRFFLKKPYDPNVLLSLIEAALA